MLGRCLPPSHPCPQPGTLRWMLPQRHSQPQGARTGHSGSQCAGSVGALTGRAWSQTPQGGRLWTGSSVCVAFLQKPQCPFLFHESVPLRLLQWFSCLVPQGGGSKAPVPTSDVPSGQLLGHLPASPLNIGHATQPVASSSLFMS